MIRGRHREDCGAPELCAGCLPCPEEHCLVCRREHAVIACPECLSRTRVALGRVGVLTGKLRVEATLGRGSLHPQAGIPGGVALVLASPAATEHGYAAQLAHRVANQLDVSHTNEEHADDPRPPLAVLTHWEDRTRALLGDPTKAAPDVGESVAYLDRHLHELARDVSFVAFSRTMDATVRQLEDALLDGIRPERSRVPCLECGTRLVKVWTDKAATDHWTCPRCQEVYDHGRYERAKHDQLASTGAERYVYLTDAASALGRHVETVRTWVRKGKVSTTRDPAGRSVIWWPDVRAAHQEAEKRAKRRDARADDE